MHRYVLVFALGLVAVPVGAQTVDFNRDVRPVLAEACFACHGPDDKARKGDLRLDTRADATAAGAIVPGKPAESAVVQRLLSGDPGKIMPPPKTGKKLTAAQVETLKKWIAEGAEYRGHWAFTAPKRAPLPKLAVPPAGFRIRNPIDAFVLARLEKEGLKPSPEADKVTLIRRVTLDLTGLPPTPAEVEAFVADASADTYEKLVDRLLASPRYGERMALEWLDAARYADTHGYHIDSGRDMTRWRDYVIRAFHTNMPFDRFTVEQFAGDLLPNPTPEQKIATGFHRNHMINFEGGAIPEEYQTAYVVDRVNTASTVWLGLSMGCAQCHDHKYDPITMKDFYRFYAFFNTIPENGLDGQRGNAAPVLRVPATGDAEKIAGLLAKVAALDTKLAGPLPEVDAGQAEWEKTPDAGKIVWYSADPAAPKSKGGATLTVLDDKSIRASGTNPATETYTVTFRPVVATMTGLRLEVFADDAMPARGPGRSGNGNFVMTGIKVSGGDKKPAALKSASADYSQTDGGFDVATTFKGGPGWAIYPEVGKDHAAVFAFASPLAAGGKDVTVELRFQSVFSQHQFGKFRLSVTDSPNPHGATTPPAAIATVLKAAARDRTPKQAVDLRAYYRASISPVVRAMKDEVAGLRKQVADIEASASTAMVMQEMPTPRETFMLVRGQYDKKGEKVSAGVPASLPPLPAGSPANRLGLAKWLVAPDHPLTARVTVNRYWQMYFGTGIVKTAEDFGTQGEFPTHPELLDWLACEFVTPTVTGHESHGWDVRHIQRLIVTSSTYRQSSRATADLHHRDPENRLLARMTRVRLPAEFLRDQSLAVSGLLNGEIGGKSVSPYQPPGIWEELAFRLDNKNFTAQIYEPSTGKDLYRRTMYTFWKRTAPPPSLVTLDAPDREVCTVRRPRTNTPLQALVLMNDPTYVEAARKLAERTMTEGGATAAERITFAFRLAAARKPAEPEVRVLQRVLDTQREKYRAAPDAAKKLLAVGASPRNEKLDAAELAAWTMVATTILNLDEVLTRN
ncbi:PSD1 and planctomycete cytochrome C domain-containing protein [Fimbriiglobus ruber]|uniref:Cytochrome c domain-containing protein n=1 Tax=Fimbriiglobus ruber TaxID=1908690 RepID=A0A225DAW6_9BACT|nr:PSD1 and planctomycete cytochrome C domain-containing protein [Fimbriiglobus ruber]OWK38113.1 protein of unknown function DUF1549 [Fimbriiglobus ruber]